MDNIPLASRLVRANARLLASLVVVLGAVAQAQAATYYVSQSGSDRSAGTSWAAAFRTPARAAQVATAGDIVVLRKSTVPYEQFTVPSSGTQNAPIVFRGEDPDDRPLLSGASIERGWKLTEYEGVWAIDTTAAPNLLLEDGHPLPQIGKRPMPPTEFTANGISAQAVRDNRPPQLQLTPGTWAFIKDRLYYRPTDGVPTDHEIWRPSHGGGISIIGKSWIEIQDIICRVGNGACVSIQGGSHNTVRRVASYWYWRGVNIYEGANDNLVEDCFVTGNHEGVYILNRSSRNTVRRCDIQNNGNLPIWTDIDRAGIAVGGGGPNFDNVVEDSEVVGNGGPNSDAGLIAYDSPRSVFRRNNVHDNFGSGILVTIGSNGSLVEENTVASNGVQGTTLGYTNISGLSVRRSNNVTVQKNKILNNYVAPNSPWKGKDLGPRGGLDVRGLSTDDMRNIKLFDNTVSGTVGGPNFYVTPGPNVAGLEVDPSL